MLKKHGFCGLTVSSNPQSPRLIRITFYGNLFDNVLTLWSQEESLSSFFFFCLLDILAMIDSYRALDASLGSFLASLELRVSPT